MRFHCLFALLLVCLSWGKIHADDCSHDCQSHTFFVPRDISTNNLLQHNLTLYWWYRVIHHDHDSFMTLQTTAFAQRSTNGDQIARFFMPCNQACARVKEDGTGTIGSLWLNLQAPENESIDGCFCMNPRETIIGNYINIRINWNPKIGQNFWTDFAFAVMKSKHDLRLCTEQNVPGDACDVTTICQALNQDTWEFGKLCPETQTKYGVDNVEIKVGYDWYFKEGDDIDHLSPYGTITIPTGKTSSPECLFEPIVGVTLTGVGFGTIADYNIWQPDDDHELTILTDFKFLYGLSTREERSFDLCKNGDWSRYLQVVKADARSDSMPGINLFTQEVKIRLRSRIDWWVGLHYRTHHWDYELGWDLFWQQAEKITLCGFPSDYGIYDIAGDCNQNPVSASCAQICQSVVNNVAPSDETFVKLTACDLNIASGTMPRSLTNSVYGALGYDGIFYTLPALICIGASYEHSVDRNALSNWRAWFKVGLSY